ncbi:MAG TPA: urease accessory protein UreD [Chloroflexota bacterium]|nr:urease accessory protein UreD [Chloroflexota bacterium]
MRPHRTDGGDWLSLVVLTPSGGLLDGDDLQAEIVVERGARLALRTQAATQLHSGRSSQSWSISLDQGAHLSYLPHPLVPHAGATHYAKVSVAMAGSAHVLLAEAVAPGRAHRGELFAYDELRSDLDVWCDGSLIARERQVLRPRASMLCAHLGPYGYFASAYALGPETLRFDCASLPISPTVPWGVSELARGGVCMRLLGQRMFDLEQALANLGDCWRASLPGSCYPRLPALLAPQEVKHEARYV